MSLRTAHDWFLKACGTDEEIRKEAERWDMVAQEAAADGDTHHATLSKNNAASLRQLAREKRAGKAA